MPLSLPELPPVSTLLVRLLPLVRLALPVNAGPDESAECAACGDTYRRQGAGLLRQE